MRQLTLFPGAGRDVLFAKGVLSQFLSEREHDPIPNGTARVSALQRWTSNLDAHASGLTESQLESAFVAQVLETVLGYTLYPAESFSAWPKPPAKATRLSRTPDLVLGDFHVDAPPSFFVAVELKSPGTDLDKPQSREKHETPVEQAFDYGRNLYGVKWVIVSDMRMIRLYSVEDPGEYQEFDLAAAGSDAARFRRLWWLLGYDSLVAKGEDSVTSSLHVRSSERRISLRDGFYSIYWQVRVDLYDAIEAATVEFTPRPTRADLLEATQRLLDRILFILYCEDHPQSLIPRDTLKHVTEMALSLPGAGSSKVYSVVKTLFREVDEGSPPESGLNVAAYNGELFKWHPILDVIDLPDSLSRKRYTYRMGRDVHPIRGVWGLHAFDFYGELGEHMLGRVFEASLSDLVELGTDSPADMALRLQERKRVGVFYTSEVLADFLAGHAIADVFEDRVKQVATDIDGDTNDPELRLRVLAELRILDPACGSGAFLVASYRVLLDHYWKWRQISNDLHGETTLLTSIETAQQSALLRGSIFGLDLLTQAVDIAKLALWLRSARKEERVSDLSSNIAAHDSLMMEDSLALIGLTPGTLDVVIGNPPWGGEMDPRSYRHAVGWLGLDASRQWDSWEIFVLLALKALRPGGRLAFVLPDSLLYPDKALIRETLLSGTTIDRLHSLGPSWFGPEVRMGTLVIEATKTPPAEAHDIAALLLSGRQRKDAILARVPLTQLESQQSRMIPQARSLEDPPNFPIEVFRDRRDDELLQKIAQRSKALIELCDRARGEEMSKEGLLWICPSCLHPSVPGRKLKGGRLDNKACPNCSYLMSEGQVNTIDLINDGAPGAHQLPYIDGDDLAHRFQLVTPTKAFRTDVAGWQYKDLSLYRSEKLLIRQAGVGLVASLDRLGSVCPQSLYIYRLKPEFLVAGYRHEFLLGALLSRTMSYIVFKRFAEVDPDKAHPKLTHTRLADLPIPSVALDNSESRELHDRIVEAVTNLLEGSDRLGGESDRSIEQDLRRLWGISPEEGSYINGEFGDLPYGQAIRELFPDGPPKRPAAPVGQLITADADTLPSVV